MGCNDVTMRANRHWLGYVIAAVCTLSLTVSKAVLLTPATVFGPEVNVGKPPPCVRDYNYFRDFMKCDASISYCFHYDNQSCIGPTNWACTDPMNRRAKSVQGESKKVFLKRAGLGNSRCCGGRYQSPINIPVTEAQCNSGRPDPHYLNGHQAVVGILENYGLNLEFKVLPGDYDKPLVLTDVPFSCAVPGSSHYIFSSLQIHSGSAERSGSEHLLQGIRYDAEIHLVHIRRDFWKPSVPADGLNPKQPSKLDMRCASQTPLGITIIAILLSLTKGELNKELGKLLRLKNLAAIKKTDKSCPLSKLCNFPIPSIDDTGGQNIIVARGDMCSQSVDSEDEGDDGVRAIFIKGHPGGLGDGDYRVGGDEHYAIFSAVNGNGRSLKEDLPHLFNILSSKRATRSSERRGRRQAGRKKRSARAAGLCFCRRRRYRELFLYYAKRGEEFQCRWMHHFDTPFLNANGRPRGSGKDEPCNQFDNDPLPCHRANKRLKLKPGRLLPLDSGYYQYFGSLTTPPCSEVVNWIVMRQPLLITPEQLNAIRNMESRNSGEGLGAHGNVRPPLPVNGRAITSNIC